MSLRQKISELRHKPYETRLKVLWILVGATTILVILVWILTLEFREAPPSDNASSKFRDILKTLEQLKTPWQK